MPLDPNNTDAKACRYWGGGIFAAAMIGEFGCGIGFLAGGNTHDIKTAAIGIGCVALVGALLFLGGYATAYKRDTFSTSDAYSHSNSMDNLNAV